jgi:hypothetical protein
MSGFSYLRDGETQTRPRISDAAIGAALLLRSSEDLEREAGEHEKKAGELEREAKEHFEVGLTVGFLGLGLGPVAGPIAKAWATGEAVIAGWKTLEAQEETEKARQLKEEAAAAKKREEEARRRQEQEDHANSEKVDRAIRDTGNRIRAGPTFDYRDVPSQEDGHSYA